MAICVVKDDLGMICEELPAHSCQLLTVYKVHKIVEFYEKLLKPDVVRIILQVLREG
ncbi:hypothetical protein BTN49_1440 [Candidatus Enterovibrio escicola]|uniref:Uncharacterized protein n=1 Tax=Candidatus Enterovibrio escicola TaxID=1927127 RepID=A0A2A5T3Z3_9GAMM|nr:hypothetical protein BTN49_1440 [Candidatus Enterovibrio escacola]